MYYIYVYINLNFRLNIPIEYTLSVGGGCVHIILDYKRYSVLCQGT